MIVKHAVSDAGRSDIFGFLGWEAIASSLFAGISCQEIRVEYSSGQQGHSVQ
jgi:hypothetical protein